MGTRTPGVDSMGWLVGESVRTFERNRTPEVVVRESFELFIPELVE